MADRRASFRWGDGFGVHCDLVDGRSLICPCGTVKLWFGERVSAENSQHIFDWWTLTHFVGGAVFYFIAWLIARRWLTVGRIALLTVVMIVAWEIVENTDFVIDRYRGAGAWDYYGDSVINAFADMVAGVIGIAAAIWLPTWTVVLTVIAVEMVGAVAKGAAESNFTTHCCAFRFLSLHGT